MTDIFVMKIEQIQPSQLYVNSKKLSEVLAGYDELKPEMLEPLPVKKLENDIVLTDDHSIALAAVMRGISEIRVYWDDVESDWEAYQTCVNWCKEEGIHSISDLKDRVVSPEQFEILWVKRCNKLAEELEKKRSALSFSIVSFEDKEQLEQK